MARGRVRTLETWIRASRGRIRICPRAWRIRSSLLRDALARSEGMARCLRARVLAALGTGRLMGARRGCGGGASGGCAQERWVFAPLEPL
eukprot:3051953-Pyramimonas_sp.AAC.1